MLRLDRIKGWVAEWSCSGLQLRGRRFDSDPSLQFIPLLTDFTRLFTDLPRCTHIYFPDFSTILYIQYK